MLSLSAHVYTWSTGGAPQVESQAPLVITVVTTGHLSLLPQLQPLAPPLCLSL